MSDIVEVLSSLALTWKICGAWFQSEDRKNEAESEFVEGSDYPRDFRTVALQSEIAQLEERMKETGYQKLRRKHESELSKLQAKLPRLKKQIEAEQAADWEEADSEFTARGELLEQALRFCWRQTGVGHQEILAAALVGFDASELPLLHAEMPTIISRLRNISPNKWKTKTWARPISPSKKAKRSVSLEKLQRFAAPFLKMVDAVCDAEPPAKRKADESLADRDADGISPQTTSVKAGGKGGEDKQDGQTDTPKKSKIKSSRRLLDIHAKACIKEFKEYRKLGELQSMREIVKEYVATHDGVSESGTYRRLTDNHDQWAT